MGPAGIGAIITLTIVGRLLGLRIDARYLIGFGLFVLAIGGYWMSRLNVEIGPWQVVWPRLVFIAGLSATFAPLNVASFINIPPQLRGAAVGLLALLRNEGGSVGTSLAADSPGTTRPISQFTSRRKSGPAKSIGKFIFRSSSAFFSSANR